MQGGRRANHKEDAVRVLKAANGNPFDGFEAKVRIHSHIKRIRYAGKEIPQKYLE